MSLPGGTYLVTRTTLERRLFLRPGPDVNQVFEYCLFRAAQKYAIDVHAVGVQSNHFHAVVTDTCGQLSEFMRWLDRHVALCLIELYAKTHPHHQLEGIWSKQPFNATLLLTPEAVLDEIVYTLTNPVKDGMVRDYRKWPGVVSRPRDWLQPVRFARRPELYFSQSDPELRDVPAQLTIPHQFRDRRTSHTMWKSSSSTSSERLRPRWRAKAGRSWGRRQCSDKTRSMRPTAQGPSTSATLASRQVAITKRYSTASQRSGVSASATATRGGSFERACRWCFLLALT